MKKFPLSPLVRAALSVAMALALGGGCFDSDSPQPPTSKPTKAAISQDATASGWPPPAEANLPVADDLLADNWEFDLDASGSMGSTACGTGNNARMEAAKSAVIKFSNSLPEGVNRGLVVFSEKKRSGIEEWLKLGPGNRAEFARLVETIQPSGSTPLRSSIELSAAKLTQQAQMQRGYGTYHLVIVTDGEADSGQDPAKFTKDLVANTAVTVHVIGFCVDGKHSLDIKGYTQYTSADNPSKLAEGLQKILAESESFVDSQYVKQ